MSTPIVAATLSACFDRRSRWFVALLYSLFSVCAMLTVYYALSRDKAQGATLLIGVGTAVVWAYGASGGLVLMQDARALRMPSIARSVVSVLLVLLIVTVVVPAALLRLYGGDFLLFSGVLASAAFGAVLWTLLPRALAAALPIMLVLGRPDSRLMLRLLPHHSHFATLAWMMALLLGALAAWRWQHLVGRERGPLTWDSPALLGLLQQTQSQSDPRNVGAGVQPVDLFSGLRATGSVAGLGPHHPVSAMRACLGSLFAPQSWRQLGTGLGIGLSWLLISVLLITRGGEAKVWLPLTTLMAGAVLLTAFRARLRLLYQRRGGEMTELALLPGWGNSLQARHILLRAVFQPLAVGMLAVFILIVGLGFSYDLWGQTPINLILICMLVGAALTGVAFCLRALAAMPISFLAIVSVIAFAFVLFFTFVPLQARYYGNRFSAGALWLTVVAWLVVVALMALLSLHAYRRFTERPHPFLTS